ncbi:MAG: sulfite exporter TauE/SafE family protein [Elusimicrobia bacterium]|nr:sulfite exporter TauE/SafE family protein [Elusimicrobiota bacterium]
MEINALLLTAASVGFIHTVLGPDHYLPFIAMARARDWSYPKTGVIVFLCGLGHVGSSVLLGLAGVYAGAKLAGLQAIESFRGGLAGWLLLVFGLFYFIWGLKRACSGRPHEHAHSHGAFLHSHSHSHSEEHAHVHEGGKASITPWILFTIFVFGPCEPLIPLVMYPAAKGSLAGMFAVTLVFALTTIAAMFITVFAALRGIQFLPVRKLAKYSHAMAGFAILMCGGAVVFLGL